MATFNYKLRENYIQIIFSYGRKKLFSTNTGYKVKNVKNWKNNQEVKCVIEEHGINWTYYLYSDIEFKDVC